MKLLLAWPARPRFSPMFACLALVASLLPNASVAAAAEIEGKLTFSGRQSNKARPRDAVVSFVPAQRVPAQRVPTQERERPKTTAGDDATTRIATVRKNFRPRVLAIPVGTTVHFPNQDTILHNVFSASKPNDFDLGIYGQGEGKNKTFEQPGVVRIYCNVHPQMVAHILVVESPFSVRPDDEGNFRLEGLPPGAGTLTVWHERAASLSREVVLPLAGPIALDLVLTRSRLPPHFNKFGKPYKSRRGRRY